MDNSEGITEHKLLKENNIKNGSAVNSKKLTNTDEFANDGFRDPDAYHK